MFSSTAYVIRHATEADAAVLRRLAGLDSAAPLTGAALIGELDGEPAAAIALDSGRVVADPFRPTAALIVHLRLRADGLRTAERRPRLRDRIRFGIRTHESVHRSPARTWPAQTPIAQLNPR